MSIVRLVIGSCKFDCRVPELGLLENSPGNCVTPRNGDGNGYHDRSQSSRPSTWGAGNGRAGCPATFAPAAEGPISLHPETARNADARLIGLRLVRAPL